MDNFLSLARLAFRRVYGLPDEPGHTNDEITENLRSQARQHRVMGLLEAGLSFSSRMSPDLTTPWQRAVFGQAQHASRYTHEAERLHALLSPILAQIALIKGPALAAQAWPDPGLRSFDDLDYRCRKEDLPAFHAVMSTAGYSPEIVDQGRRDNLWHYGWGVTYRHVDGFMVEINHRFFPPHFPWPRLLGTANPYLYEDIALDGQTIRTLTPAMHLLLSCLHALWHGWERLAWIVDIAGLLVRYPDSFLRADQLVGQNCFARRALHTGSQLAENIFGPDLVKTPLNAANHQAVDTAYACLMRSTPGVSWNDQRRCHRQLLSPGEAFCYNIRRYCIPGDGDFRAWNFSGNQRALYWMLRPLRGVWKRG